MTLADIRDILLNNKLLLETTRFDGDFFSRTEKISCDSRDVSPGTLFFAKGISFKREYLVTSIEKGAVAYVSERDYNVDLPLFLVSDLRKAMPAVAKEFYGDPVSAYPLVGITGTKGKSSTAYMLRSIFNEAYGEKTGIISTNEARCGEKTWKKTGTTPESLELYSILAGFRDEGAKAAVMEVSSQALKYDRVNGVMFKVGAFLNLSPDHISPTEHSSFDDYKAAKKRLLTLCKTGIVNIDDEYSSEIIAAATCKNIITTAISSSADIAAYSLRGDKHGTTFSLKGLVSINDVRLEMPGKFNVYNALCAAACAHALGISDEKIRDGLERASAAGRLEIIEKNGITVLVDYAHNKSSFEAVFDYVETYYPDAKKIVLFGCVGNKALDRRVELPEVACPHSDFIVMTSDDPASEEPEDIFAEVEPELKRFSTPYVFIKDREEAVGYAIDKAESGDIVILAGKGHEKTQAVKGKQVPYVGDLTAAEKRLAEKRN